MMSIDDVYVQPILQEVGPFSYHSYTTRFDYTFTDSIQASDSFPNCAAAEWMSLTVVVVAEVQRVASTRVFLRDFL